MSRWKEMSKAEKIAALQPLFAHALTYREIAAVMGTSSGAIAGFVFTNPSAKPPRLQHAAPAADRLTFGDGIASARIAVRLKATKTPPPAGPSGTRDPQSAPNRDASAVDEASPEAGPQAEASHVGTDSGTPAGRGAHSREGAASPAVAEAASSGTAAPVAAAPKRFKSWASMKFAERVAAVRELSADGKLSGVAMAEALDTTMHTLAAWRSENKRALNAQDAPVQSSPAPRVERIVADRRTLNPVDPKPHTVSVALVPSLQSPDPEEPGARTSRALAVIPPPSLPAAPPGNVCLLATTERRCKFPIWQHGVDAPPGDEAGFCGAFIAAGRVYCDHHRAAAYVPPKVRERTHRRIVG